MKSSFYQRSLLRLLVSNPWREAIEALPASRSNAFYGFPILGGRLLKHQEDLAKAAYVAFPILGGRLLKEINEEKEIRFRKVSNPWREAIEEKRCWKKWIARKCFQSLEGGY